MNVSKLALFLQVVYILHDMPIIGYNFPAIVYAVIVVFLFVYLCNKVEYRHLKTLFLVFFIQILGFSLELFYVTDVVTLLQKLSSLFQSWIYPLMAISIIRSSDIKSAHVIFFVYLIGVLITGITTYSCLLEFPGAIREVVSESTSHPLFLYFVNRNLGGFDYIYGLLTVEVALIYMIRNVSAFPKQNVARICLGIAIFFLVLLIIESEFTMAIMCSLGILIIFFLPKILKLRHIVFAITLGSVLFIGAQKYVANVMEDISMHIESENISERLADLSSSIKGEESSEYSDVEMRKKAWQKPVLYFTENPIGAWNNKDVSSFGGHSFILDSIGKYGVFSFLFIFMMFKSVYFSIISNVSYEKKGYIWISYFIFLLTAIVNPHLNTKDILFFIPLFFLIFDYYKKRYASHLI